MPGKADPTLVDRIKEAGLACFSEKGFAGATMADIARRAGISPAAIYRYFPGKRELFDSLGRPELDRPSPRLEERRQEILAAALTVFAGKGYAGATVDDVAQAVGLSKAALYVYFPSKEQLFEAVCVTTPEMSEVQGLLASVLGGRGRPAVEAETLFRQIADGFLRMYRDPTRLKLLRIILAESGRVPAVSQAFLSGTVSRGAGAVGSLLAQYGYGTPDEMKKVAQGWIGMLFAWVVTNRVVGSAPSDDRPSEDEIAAISVRLLLHGLAPRP